MRNPYVKNIDRFFILTLFGEDINANAKGYAFLYRMETRNKNLQNH